MRRGDVAWSYIGEKYFSVLEAAGGGEEVRDGGPEQRMTLSLVRPGEPEREEEQRRPPQPPPPLTSSVPVPSTGGTNSALIFLFVLIPMAFPVLRP